MCVFSLANDGKIDVHNYKQMGRRRESDTYRLSERPRNSWWLHGQRPGDKEKLGQNQQYRLQPERISTAHIKNADGI